MAGRLDGSDGDGDGGPTVGILEDCSESLQLNGISKWQATQLAIEESNEDSGILGVVGQNGVGKTTLIKASMRFSSPEQGTVKFNGGDLTDQTADAHPRASIGYVPQGRDVFAGFTVKQNLMIGKSIGEGDSTALYDQVYEFFPVSKSVLSKTLER